MNKKIVTFGEIMLRLAVPDHKRIAQTDTFEVTYAGGEANVAVSLANYGFDAYFVTKLPSNDIGNACKRYLWKHGIKTDYIIFNGDRLGVYYLEAGASQRPSKVIYDRAHSAISEIMPGEINWKDVFQETALFHFTGITPALSDNAAEVTMEALKIAKSMGVYVTCDLNYRKKLWSEEKANHVMTKLMKYVDMAVGNEEDAENVFGIKAKNTDVTGAELNYAGYQEVAEELYNRFNLEKVAITLRESYSASDNGWSAMLYDGIEYFRSKKYDIHIIDRVGGGDSFCGGLIYGIMSGMDNQSALEYAVAASCLKHTIPGDFNMVTVDEVMNLVEGDSSGRVQR